MLDDQLLGMIRDDLGDFLNETCTIEREDVTKGTSGGVKRTWVAAQSQVKCRVLPQQGRDAKGMVAGAEAGRVFFRLIVAYDTDVQDGDRVNKGGVNYEITLVDDAWTDKAFKALDITRIG